MSHPSVARRRFTRVLVLGFSHRGMVRDVVHAAHKLSGPTHYAREILTTAELISAREAGQPNGKV